MINLKPSQLQKDETIEFTFSRTRIRGRVLVGGRIATVATDGAALGHKELQLFEEFADVYRIKVVAVAKRLATVEVIEEKPSEPVAATVGDLYESQVQEQLDERVNETD